MIEYTSERRCFLIASKGQKFKNYDNSANIKVVILEEYKLKRNIKELAESLKVKVESFKEMGQKKTTKKDMKY